MDEGTVLRAYAADNETFAEQPEFLGAALGWILQVLELLEDPKRHIVLDPTMTGVVESLREVGFVDWSPEGLERFQRAGVGGGLIARLPSFPERPIDEILDFRRRKAIAGPLARYRAATIEIADALRATDSGLDLTEALREIKRTKVDPALAEIYEVYAESGFVKEVVRETGESMTTRLAAGSAVWALWSSVTDLSTVTGAVLASAGTATEIASRARKQQRTARAPAKKNDFFYLSQIEKM